MFDDVNILDELRKENSKNDNWSEQDFLTQVGDILSEGASADEELLQLLKSKNKESISSLSQVNGNDVFTEKAIKQICEKYRLRFLDSHYFVGKYPYEALEKIKEIEKANQKKLSNFYVMAPSKLFQLDDAHNDPLLFTRIGEGKFLLIHQWGSDLSWWKKVTAFPARNYKNLALTIVSFALLLSFLVPNSWIGNVDHLGWTRFGIFMQIMLLLSAITVYVACLFQKNFSASEWRSSFFND